MHGRREEPAARREHGYEKDEKRNLTTGSKEDMGREMGTYLGHPGDH